MKKGIEILSLRVKREIYRELKATQRTYNKTETRLEDLNKYHQNTKNALLLPHSFSDSPPVLKKIDRYQT
jgi:hypothetical protein